jgi:hypothetical protein
VEERQLILSGIQVNSHLNVNAGDWNRAQQGRVPNFCCCELCLQPGYFGVQGKDVRTILFLRLDELILSVEVVVDEFLNADLSVAVHVALAEEFINNLLAVLVVDSHLEQPRVYLSAVQSAVAIGV